MTGNSIRRLVFGVSAHGLGHLTRACQLANALFELDPGLEFHFWTDLPEERIASDLVMPFGYRRVAYEPGTSHKNCFELDPEQTVRNYELFGATCDARILTEKDALRSVEPDAVISDAPAILVRAAADVGIPAICVSNFTWDWILEPILEGSAAEPILHWLRESYGAGAHHIRLPFGPTDSPFPSSERGPLISRRSRLAPIATRELLALGPPFEKRIVLVCPGGWDADDWSRIRPDTDDFQLVLVGDLPVETREGDLSLPHALVGGLRFPDLVELADVVLAKPGYGIASECVSHRTPLVTIDRPAFRETALLRDELSKLGPCSEIGLDDFFAGRWTRALDAALTNDAPWAPQPGRPDLELAQLVLESLG